MSEGTATVSHFNNHYWVNVESGGRSISTVYGIGDKPPFGSTVEHPGWFPQESKTFTLPNGDEAFDFAQERAASGKTSLFTAGSNDCAGWCGKVLQKGGVDAPTKGADFEKWFHDTDQGTPIKTLDLEAELSKPCATCATAEEAKPAKTAEPGKPAPRQAGAKPSRMATARGTVGAGALGIGMAVAPVVAQFLAGDPEPPPFDHYTDSKDPELDPTYRMQTNMDRCGIPSDAPTDRSCDQIMDDYNK